MQLHDQLDLVNYSIWYESPDKFWFNIAIFFVILVVLALSVVFFMRKRLRIAKNYWQIEIERIELLRAQLNAGLSPRDFYSGLIDTLRRYIAFRYNDLLQVSTEGEMLLMIDQLQLDPVLAASIRDVITRAILVKYSEYHDQLFADVEKHGAVVLEFIQCTKPEITQ